MAKKNEFDKLIKKYQPAIDRTKEQLTKAVKVAEDDISKMYKLAQTHVEIQMTNLKKEKLYYEIGKDLAEKLSKGSIDLPGFEKYEKQLAKLDSEREKKKKILSRVGKTQKKKKSSKKS